MIIKPYEHESKPISEQDVDEAKVMLVIEAERVKDDCPPQNRDSHHCIVSIIHVSGQLVARTDNPGVDNEGLTLIQAYTLSNRLQTMLEDEPTISIHVHETVYLSGW